MKAAELNARRAVAGVAFSALGAGFLLEALGVWRVDLVYLWPLLLISLGLSMLVGRARRLALEEDRRAKLAVAEERVRIARELHDIVAHGVTLMTIQIAAARRVALRQPEAADEALAAAETAGRQSLSELRSLLAVLRSADASLGEVRFEGAARVEDDAPTAPLPRLTEIPELVATVRAAGLDVDLEVEGLVPTVTPATELTAYRVVQESLTNVVRHAPAARANVWIGYAPDSIRVVAFDDGGGFRAAPAPDGHGLVGMRERVAAVGGTMVCGPRPDGPGWLVDVVLPVVGP